MARHLVPRLAAGLAAVLGLALLVVAAVLASQSDGSTALVGSYRTDGKVPVVTTVPGTLELVGKGVTVKASSAKPDGAVFLGIGRAADVQAYLGEVSRAELTGIDPARTLTARSTGDEPSLPDPSLADIWVVGTRGTGQATLTWPEPPGRWQLVAVTDGTAPAPAEITLTWTRARTAPAGIPAMVGSGALLLVGGTVVLVVLWLRRQVRRPAPAEGEAEPEYPYAEPAPGGTGATGEVPKVSPRRAARAAREAAEKGRPVPVPAPLGDPESEATRLIPRAVPGGPGEPGGPGSTGTAEPDLFRPRVPTGQAPDTGVVDRRAATPGLVPDRPTTVLRRITAEGETVVPADDRPDHPTTVLRRIRVDRPWTPEPEEQDDSDERDGAGS